MKNHLLIKTMLLLCALVVGSSHSVWAVDVVYKSLTFSANNSTKTSGYTSSWTETVSEFSWTIENFNNNNWGWSVLDSETDKIIKCGRLRTGSKGNYVNTPSIATIKTNAVLEEAITKVVVKLTAINQTDYNSIKLYLASDADFTTNLTTISVSTIPSSAGDMTITIPEANRSANRYYKLEFDTKGSTSSNGHTGISKIDYYYTTGAALSSITLSGSYPTEFAKWVEFSHVGMTVTAQFDDSSTLDVTSNASFTGFDMETAGIQTVTVSYTEGGTTKTVTYDITVVDPIIAFDLTSNDVWEFPTAKREEETDYSDAGYTITLTGTTGNGYYFDTSNNNLLLGKSGATLQLPAFNFTVDRIIVYGSTNASGSVAFNIFDGDETASTGVTSSKIAQTFDIAVGHQGVGKVYTIKVTNDNNMRITRIGIFGNGCETGLVGNAGWATYVTTYPVTFAEGDAFAVTSVGTSVGLTSVTSVRTGTPLLLKGAGQKTAILLNEEPAAIENKLAVSDGDDGVNDYVLANHNSKVGFYKWTGTALASGKVYLPASEIPAGAREFLGFDDETTGIANINSEAKSLFSCDFYNLSGQRVAQPTKGLYIVNGKKVIIK